ncbi:Tub family-domain-containing protein [Globomyces pollinis-pini]|nr:Tub family-domain-containing protein [Globomyces pollinis-pini]
MMQTDSVITEEQRIQVKSLKKELKEWEYQFVEDNGRKPNKQDIASVPNIAMRYKSYARLKALIEKIDDGDNIPKRKSKIKNLPEVVVIPEKTNINLTESSTSITTSDARDSRNRPSSTNLSANLTQETLTGSSIELSNLNLNKSIESSTNNLHDNSTSIARNKIRKSNIAAGPVATSDIGSSYDRFARRALQQQQQLQKQEATQQNNIFIKSAINNTKIDKIEQPDLQKPEYGVNTELKGFQQRKEQLQGMSVTPKLQSDISTKSDLILPNSKIMEDAIETVKQPVISTMAKPKIIHVGKHYTDSLDNIQQSEIEAFSETVEPLKPSSPPNLSFQNSAECLEIVNDILKEHPKLLEKHIRAERTKLDAENKKPPKNEILEEQVNTRRSSKAISTIEEKGNSESLGSGGSVVSKEDSKTDSSQSLFENKHIEQRKEDVEVSMDSLINAKSPEVSVQPTEEEITATIASTKNGVEQQENALGLPLNALVKNLPSLMVTNINSRMEKHGVLRCKLYRKKNLLGQTNPTYILHNEADNSFLLAAKKMLLSKSINYIISDSPDDFSKDSIHYVGKLKANFKRTSFILSDTRSSTSQKTQRELAIINYSKNVLPRELQVAISAMTIPEDTALGHSTDITEDFRIRNENTLLFLKNKPPRWNEATQSHCLNFGGRVTQPSIKNMQLISDITGGKNVYNVLQFGRCGSDFFSLDVRYPMTVLEAFGIALTTFDAYDSA